MASRRLRKRRSGRRRTRRSAPRFRRIRGRPIRRGIRRRGLKRKFSSRGGLSIRPSSKRPISRNRAVNFFADDVVELNVSFAPTNGFESTAIITSGVGGVSSNMIRIETWRIATAEQTTLWTASPNPDNSNVRKYFSQNIPQLPQCTTGPLITTMPSYYKYYRILSTRFTMAWAQGFCKFSANPPVPPFVDYAPRSGLIYAFIWVIHDPDKGDQTPLVVNGNLTIEKLRRQRYCVLRPIQMNPNNFVPGKLSFKIKHAAAFGSSFYNTLMTTYKTDVAPTYYTDVLRYTVSSATADGGRLWLIHGFITSDGSAFGGDPSITTTTANLLLNYRTRVSQKFLFSEPHSSDEIMPTINSAP